MSKEKTPKQKASSAFSAITPLLGLATEIATAIPDLKKVPPVQAHTSALPITQAMTGVAAGGHGVGRGGNFLQALRAGGAVGQQVADVASQRALQAGMYNTQQNVARTQRVSEFGSDTAAGMADLAVGLGNLVAANKGEEVAAPDPTDQNNWGGLQSNQKAQGFKQPDQGHETAQGLVNTLGPRLDKINTERKKQGIPDAQQMSENPSALQSSMVLPLQQELQALEKTASANVAEALDQAFASVGMVPPSYLVPVLPHVAEQARNLNILVDEVDRSGLSLATMLPPLMSRMGANIMNVLNPPANPLPEEDSIA